MEQSKLSNPRFVFKKFLSENLILSSSVLTFHKIPLKLYELTIDHFVLL